MRALFLQSSSLCWCPLTAINTTAQKIDWSKLTNPNTTTNNEYAINKGQIRQWHQSSSHGKPAPCSLELRVTLTPPKKIFTCMRTHCISASTYSDLQILFISLKKAVLQSPPPSRTWLRLTRGAKPGSEKCRLFSIGVITRWGKTNGSEFHFHFHPLQISILLFCIFRTRMAMSGARM